MSTILVNNIKSYTGTTVTVSGSNISVTGNTTLGDNSGVDTITINGHITASGNISASGDITANNLTLNGNASTLSGVTNATVTNATITKLATSQISSSAFGGTVEVSGSITPNADDAFDLGSSGKQWKDLYIDGTANIDNVGNGVSIPSISSSIEVSGSITPINQPLHPVTYTHNLGASGKEWFEVHADTLVAGYIKPANYGNTFTLGISGSVTTSGSITPDADDTYDLGSSGKQWKDLYVDGTANIDNLVTSQISGSIEVSGSITPSGDDAFDLGSSGKQWKDLYIDGTANIDVISAASLTLDQDITTAANTDAAFYSIDGKRVEIRSQLQGGIAVDTGWTVELRNTSIAANSLIVANVIGGNGAIITGSVVSANVIAASTASVNFFNVGAAAIVDNAFFTASIAVF
jgi:hypothetical protein